MTDAHIRLGKLTFKNTIMNSSGPWAASYELLDQLNDSQSGAVVTKTFTLDATKGNPEPNTYFDDRFSINSVGLTNKGSDYFIDYLDTATKKKPFIASIFESSGERFVELLQKTQRSGFDAIELNLSCPNVVTKEPVAYSAQLFDALLELLFRHAEIPIGLKLPPYVTRSHINDIVAVITKYPINHIVLINTYPFATMFSDSQAVIAPNSGIGGLGGTYLKPIALAHIVLFRRLLPDVPIVGVGGIANKQDIADFLLAGADAVQVGSYLKEDVRLIDRLVRPD